MELQGPTGKLPGPSGTTQLLWAFKRPSYRREWPAPSDIFPQLPSRRCRLLSTRYGTGTFPEAWREATVIPILKAGKSGLDPLHYRPISVTSSLSKLMEKMVNVRLSWFLEHHGVFTNDYNTEICIRTCLCPSSGGTIKNLSIASLW